MLEAAIERLRAADEKLTERAPLLSLCPDRQSATPLVVLAGQLLPRDVAPELAGVFADGMSRIAEAIGRNFPGNIFWDLDFVAATLLSLPNPRAITTLADAIVEVHDLFGSQTTIRFRYAHDFIYGFDWAKWVARDPKSRKGFGPFTLEVLQSMRDRGGELLDLIAHDDAKYPQLLPGQDRNPFRFAREPGAEQRLHRDLARRGLLPVETWRVDAEPAWRRPYAKLRDERARELGLEDQRHRPA